MKKFLYDEANDIFNNSSLISYFNMHFYFIYDIYFIT